MENVASAGPLDKGGEAPPPAEAESQSAYIDPKTQGSAYKQPKILGQLGEFESEEEKAKKKQQASAPPPNTFANVFKKLGGKNKDTIDT
jgi:hypothetical protein